MGEMHAWIVAAVLCQSPVELTIVVAEPWEECERSEFVVDSFTSTCEELEGILSASRSAWGDRIYPSAQNGSLNREDSLRSETADYSTSTLSEKCRRFVTDYHARLVELRAECEPWRIVTWSDVGDSDMECPAWTLDRLGRRKPKWVKFREDVLIGYHPDVLMHLRYVKRLREREHALLIGDGGEFGWGKMDIIAGSEKWFRRRHNNCQTADGRVVTFHYDEPIIQPWPPVRVRLGWCRMINGRVEYDAEANCKTPPNTEVVRYEPDWSVILPELDMGAGVFTQLHGSE